MWDIGCPLVLGTRISTFDSCHSDTLFYLGGRLAGCNVTLIMGKPRDSDGCVSLFICPCDGNLAYLLCSERKVSQFESEQGHTLLPLGGTADSQD